MHVTKRDTQQRIKTTQWLRSVATNEIRERYNYWRHCLLIPHYRKTVSQSVSQSYPKGTSRVLIAKKRWNVERIYILYRSSTTKLIKFVLQAGSAHSLHQSRSSSSFFLASILSIHFFLLFTLFLLHLIPLSLYSSSVTFFPTTFICSFSNHDFPFLRYSSCYPPQSLKLPFSHYILARSQRVAIRVQLLWRSWMCSDLSVN